MPGFVLRLICLLCGLSWMGTVLPAEPVFRLPTVNRALFEGSDTGNQAFFAPTTSGRWTSGRFGCTRSSGWKFHEGIDIRFTERDQRGEPQDAIFAVANGKVCYINKKPGLSNYGNYIILGHKIEGLEIFTFYAHLSEISEGVVPGRIVEAGARIATMGRTTNAGTIARYRAHLHFEITLVVHENFDHWFQLRNPGQDNDHGLWNGRNFIGMDPEDIFREQSRQGSRFRLTDYIRDQMEYFTVYIPETEFPWLKRYQPLVQPRTDDPQAEITGHEITFNAFGLPFRMKPVVYPEATSQVTQVVRVKDAMHQAFKCRRLISKRGGQYTLTSTASSFLDLLTFDGK